MAHKIYLVKGVSIRYYLSMPRQMTQQLLERLASLLRSESRSLLFAHGLQPIQFEALHYLSLCNRYSNTPMGVTEYLGQTKGTVSQTLKVLEKKELIVKRPDAKDKRVAHMEVTQQGLELINQILPSPLLQATAELCSDQDMEAMDAALGILLRKIQQANGFKTFGQCSHCRHHTKLDNSHYFCGLTQETLDSSDTTLICREHEPIT